jgi:23S rRNA pseudouridine2605 synthase
MATCPRRLFGDFNAGRKPGWNGIESMSRRRSFPAEGPRSNQPAKSRRPRPGPGPRPRSVAPDREHRPGSRHDQVSTPRTQTDAHGDETGKLERVQKVLAHAGLGSRRACEQLILQGRVSVDGAVVRVLGTRVDPARARIAVDGEPIKRESIVYFAVNKPKGYVSTNFDPAGRPRVVDLLPEIPERVYTVGRLDEDSTGLMILTNDGDLANRLAHPRYGVEKLYRALVAGLPSREMLAKLTEGVWLSDGKVRAKRARFVGRQGQATLLELVLAEGKKREIRRMLSKLGHKVMSLNRVAVGPVSLKGLSVGQCRPLSRHEVDLLRKVASGVAVSLPRSFDADSSSSRPFRDSHRPRTAEAGRRTREGGGPPRGRPHRSHDGPGPHPGSKPARPPRPGRPISAAQRTSSPPLPHRRKAGAKPPPRPKTKTGIPAESRRAADSTPRPAPLVPSRRRIIGLQREPPAGSGSTSKGGRGRRRPPARKRQPPRATPPKNSILSSQPHVLDDEEA